MPTKMPTVFMFSGQGSQYYQMAKELLDIPVFNRELLALDTIAIELNGKSIISEVFNPLRKVTEPFLHTRITSPAIYMIEVAIAKTLIANGVKPDYVLGYSLGTMAAAVTSGCISKKDALGFIFDQANALETYCQPGHMIAVVGPKEIYQKSDILRTYSELAAINFDSHFVVSTNTENLALIENELEPYTTQKLAVSQAFHSRWIDPAMTSNLEHANRLSMTSPLIPMACCVQGGIVNEFTPEQLWTFARHPIRFQQTISSLERRGPMYYIDCGPSGTLATFLKYLLPKTSDSRPYSIISPFGGDARNLKKVVNELSQSSATAVV